MGGGGEEEPDEGLEVAVADTGAYPGAVVVVKLDADAALAAVE